MTDAVSFASAWLPERPWVTDPKGHPTWRTSRESALLLPYIEANATGVMQPLIVTDRDLPDADLIAERLGQPAAPSYASLNAHTTAGHIVYVLKDPVCLTDAARRHWNGPRDDWARAVRSHTSTSTYVHKTVTDTTATDDYRSDLCDTRGNGECSTRRKDSLTHSSI